jgi:hypothetical protein
VAAQYSCFIGILVGWAGRLKVFVMGGRKLFWSGDFMGWGSVGLFLRGELRRF